MKTDHSAEKERTPARLKAEDLDTVVMNNRSQFVIGKAAAQVPVPVGADRIVEVTVERDGGTLDTDDRGRLYRLPCRQALVRR